MFLSLSRQDYSPGGSRAFRYPYAEGQRDCSPFSGVRPEAKSRQVDPVVEKSSSWSDERKQGEKEDHSLARKSGNANDNEGENEHDAKDGRNFTETFVAVIAQSILSVPARRMTLSSIYSYIAKHYPHFDKEKGPGWRNSVRHNLSSNDCFVKASRAENGKGHYWMIHPKDAPEFSKGNFRRPRKPRRPRCNHALSCASERSILGLSLSPNIFPAYHPTAGKTADFDYSLAHGSSEAMYSHHYSHFGSRYSDCLPRQVDAESYGGYSTLIPGLSSPYAPGLYWPETSAFRNYASQVSSYYPAFLQVPPLNTSSPRPDAGGLKTV